MASGGKPPIFLMGEHATHRSAWEPGRYKWLHHSKSEHWGASSPNRRPFLIDRPTDLPHQPSFTTCVGGISTKCTFILLCISSLSLFSHLSYIRQLDDSTACGVVVMSHVWQFSSSVRASFFHSSEPCIRLRVWAAMPAWKIANRSHKNKGTLRNMPPTLLFYLLFRLFQLNARSLQKPLLLYQGILIDLQKVTIWVYCCVIIRCFPNGSQSLLGCGLMNF